MIRLYNWLRRPRHALVTPLALGLCRLAGVRARGLPSTYWCSFFSLRYPADEWAESLL